MKILITENQFKLLKEIGDGSHILDFYKMNYSCYIFDFMTTNKKEIKTIKVNFNKKTTTNSNILGYSISFKRDNESDDYRRTYNNSPVLSIVGTIRKIIEDFIKINKPNFLIIDPSTQQRYNLYKKYIEISNDNYIVRDFIGKIFLIKKVVYHDIKLDLMAFNFKEPK